MMTVEQVSALLAVIAATDRRKVGKTDVLTWHATIGDLDFEEARAAVWQHFSQSTDWLMPAHVRRLVDANAPVHTMSQRREIQTCDDRVPMPAHIKALLRERWGTPADAACERAQSPSEALRASKASEGTHKTSTPRVGQTVRAQR